MLLIEAAYCRRLMEASEQEKGMVAQQVS